MTNTSKKLKQTVSKTEIQAYIGLEIGMSFFRLCRISDYWSSEPFLRQPDFPRFMSRNRFQNIRASLKLNYDSELNEPMNMFNPLWSIHAMLGRFKSVFRS